MPTRRSVLAGSARLTLLAQFPGLALATAARNATFVVVILRGALDGLAAVPPYAEPRYASLRGPLALGSPDAGGALKLDGLFALHPSLATLHAMYAMRELAVLHAVATPYRERSHFDGQAVLENGGALAAALRDGWLNRALGSFPSGAREAAVALAENVPLLLRGGHSVDSWSPSRLPDAADDTLERVASLYANDAVLAAHLQDGLDTRAIAAGMPAGGAGAIRGEAQLAALAEAAARFLSTPGGPRIAVLEASGWDTHANQGAEQGQLAARLAGLDAALAALKRGVGAGWRDTAVLVVTEFGRTVAVNGTRGTDHGTGACALLAGGAVAGGRVVADWPGLAERDLYEARDLRPTTDLRSIFKGVLRDHLGADEHALATAVFPDSASVPPHDGLIARPA